MEVFVVAPNLRFSCWVFPEQSSVRDVLTRFSQQQGPRCSDLFVVSNGHVSAPDDPLHHGSVYHLEPRLCGGKGGFGSMLRALGAQIEKTTNREACRDLSGRRLRDVNHEKEMAEWLKKQAEREAEKEQRRAERLQRKLKEPKHQFSDRDYQQQCHDLSERLEDSVIKGLQASSSGQVKIDDPSTTKRANCGQGEQPPQKKKKTAAACFWTGLDELLSSEEDNDDSASSSGGVPTEWAEPEWSSSSTSADLPQGHPETSRDQNTRSSEDREAPGTSGGHNTRSSEDREAPGTSGDQNTRSSEDWEAPGTSGDQNARSSEDREAPGTSGDRNARSSEDREAPGTSGDRNARSSEDREAPGTSGGRNTRSSEDREAPGTSSSSEEVGHVCVDLSSVSSAEQLERLGLDILKEELMRRGLKCGGTLTERAARLFSVRGLTCDQIDPVLLAKPGKTRRK